MRIIVNHLTRLRLGDICVAGLDEQSGKHIRPVFGLLKPRFLKKHGGFLEMACLVDLGRTKSVGEKPHIEDWEFRPQKSRIVSEAGAEEFWALLEAAARDSVRELFGDAIHPVGRSGAWGTEPGNGDASLGCLRVSGGVRLYLKPRQGRTTQIRIAFRQDAGEFDLGVTDIRLYADDRITPNTQLLPDVAKRAAEGGVILSVGLSRAFSSSPEFPPMHWLQVNNVHLPDDPCWRLA